METELYFFTIFIITIIITRVFLYIKPMPAPAIKGFRMHHYMYGLFLVLIGILLGNVTIYGLGAGLFIDEFGYLLLNGKSHEDNYSKFSFLLLGLFIVLVYVFKKQFLFWI